MYAVHVVNNIAVQQIKTESPPPGWITTNDRVALGSTWDGSTFTPPAPRPPLTDGQKEAEVQALVTQMTQGGDRDKALAMVLADLVAQSFNLPTSEARQMVRDRLVTHLRTIRGI